MQIALRLSSLLFVTDFTVKRKALRFLCKFGVSEAFQNKDMRALFSDFSEALTKVLQRHYLEENPDEKIEKKLIERFSAVIQKYPICFIQDNQRILTLIPRMLCSLHSRNCINLFEDRSQLTTNSQGKQLFLTDRRHLISSNYQNQQNYGFRGRFYERKMGGSPRRSSLY